MKKKKSKVELLQLQSYNKKIEKTTFMLISKLIQKLL
jgi:hypothetical protein